MLHIIGYIITVLIVGSAFFGAVAAGVYVGMKQDDLNRED